MRAVQTLHWRSDDGSYNVRLDRRCVQRMQRLAAEHSPREVGTSLGGYYSDGHTARVTSLAPLPPDSKAGRTWFVRGVRGLKDYFQSLNRRFRGQRFRVGEWHSHPNASPAASGLDDANHTDLCRDEREALPEAILVILGGDPLQSPRLGVYVYSQDRGKVRLRPSTNERG